MDTEILQGLRVQRGWTYADKFCLYDGEPESENKVEVLFLHRST